MDWRRVTPDIARGFCSLVSEHGCAQQQIGQMADGDLDVLVDVVFDAWQVLGLTGPRLLEAAPKSWCDGHSGRRLRDGVAGVRTYALIQEEAFGQLSDAFTQAEVPYVLLKSFATRHLVYDDPGLRAGWDMDVAVDPDCIRVAEQVCIDHGFVPAEFDRQTLTWHPANPERRAIVESDHYELGFLVRRQQVNGLPDDLVEQLERESFNHARWRFELPGAPVCYLPVDLHHGLSLDIGVRALMERTVMTAVGDRVLPLPNRAWLAFHLIFKLYWEGVHNYHKGLYQMADVVRLIPRMTSDDLDEFQCLLEQYRMEAGGYYVLSSAAEHVGLPITDRLGAVMEALRVPSRGGDPVDHNDLGDLWPRLWGVRGFAAPTGRLLDERHAAVGARQ